MSRKERLRALDSPSAGHLRRASSEPAMTASIAEGIKDLHVSVEEDGEEQEVVGAKGQF